MAQKKGLKLQFFTFNNYFDNNQNELFNYYYYNLKHEILPAPRLDENGNLFKKSRIESSFFGKIINKNKLLNLKIVRKILSTIYGKKEHSILAALLFQ